MEHPGNPTKAETVNYFKTLVKEGHLTIDAIILENMNLKSVLDELCANAEPVCDCLEMGQTLKSPDTLRNFRKALNDGWAAIPVESGTA